MYILITEKITDQLVKDLHNLGHAVVEAYEASNDYSAHLSKCETIIVESKTEIKKELIDRAKNLRLIIRAGTEINNIDIHYASAKGIQVMNTPEAATVSVAELVLGLILCAARHIPLADTSMKKGEWNHYQFMGNEIAGKMLGVVGFGRIGREVAKRALAFDMNVIACDKFLDKSPIEAVPLISRNELIKKADYITLHVPFNKKEGALIGNDEFERMKNNVVLINCARGGVIDERALQKYIKTPKIKYAALDVFEKEPSDNLELIENPKIISLPHLGSSTLEAQDKVANQIIKIIKGFQQI